MAFTVFSIVISAVIGYYINGSTYAVNNIFFLKAAAITAAKLCRAAV